MVKPNPQQLIQLNQLRDLVIEVMRDMPIWLNTELSYLKNIKLGLLKKNATQRHGATKWKVGTAADKMEIKDVDVIELHPELLNVKWNAYAAFVLHHEYIHALGFKNHNNEFRTLENSWPGINAGKHGMEFTEFLRKRSAKWVWRCGKCQKEFPRKKASLGRYRCRTCSTVLLDIKV